MQKKELEKDEGRSVTTGVMPLLHVIGITYDIACLRSMDISPITHIDAHMPGLPKYISWYCLADGEH